MAKPNEPARQLPDWIVDHMRKYVETDGKEGHIWNGVPTLLLTTTGRRSKQRADAAADLRQRRRSLSDRRIERRRSEPSGLVSQPRRATAGEGAVGTDKFTAKARDATAKERPALWALMAKIWPAYNDYQKKTDRQIPIVVLERT